MPSYVYTAWFRDELAVADDEDREWPACFVIEAPNAAEARTWGDHLAQAFSRRRGTETFVQSEVALQDTAGALAKLPTIPVGHEATDAEIGW